MDVAVFNPDGKLVATAGGSTTNTLGSRQWQTGNDAETQGGGRKRVAFSPDGKLVATAGGKPNRYLGSEQWQAGSDTRTRGRTLSSFSPDGKLMATASFDGTAGVWEVSSGKRVATLGHESRVDAVVFSSDGKNGGDSWR